MIIFSFWSFEISEGILRNQKLIIGLDSFPNQRFIFGFVWIILVFVSTSLLKVTVFLFGSILPNLEVTEETFVVETAVMVHSFSH